MGLGRRDVGGGEAHQRQRVKLRIGELLGARAQHIADEALADHGDGEGLGEPADQGQGRLDRGDLVVGEAAGHQRRVIDAGRLGQVRAAEQ